MSLGAVGKISAALAFTLCLLGGLLAILSVVGTNNEDFLYIGFGLYFIGKAFFVGPALLIISGAARSE